jgi:hypothetical protein
MKEIKIINKKEKLAVHIYFGGEAKKEKRCTEIKRRSSEVTTYGNGRTKKM